MSSRVLEGGNLDHRPDKLWTTEDYWAVRLGLGVLVNVPLGYFLSTVVFSRVWSSISSMT